MYNKIDNIDDESVVFDAIVFSKTLVDTADDPNESCGVMLGTKNHVKEIVLVENETPSPYRFEFSSRKYGEVLSYGIRKNLKLVGIYHTHPQNHPVPSMLDFDYMEDHPSIWTIYSPRHKSWGSWRRICNDVKPINTNLYYEVLKLQ